MVAVVEVVVNEERLSDSSSSMVCECKRKKELYLMGMDLRENWFESDREWGGKVKGIGDYEWGTTKEERRETRGELRGRERRNPSLPDHPLDEGKNNCFLHLFQVLLIGRDQIMASCHSPNPHQIWSQGLKHVQHMS